MTNGRIDWFFCENIVVDFVENSTNQTRTLFNGADNQNRAWNYLGTDISLLSDDRIDKLLLIVKEHFRLLRKFPTKTFEVYILDY